MSLCTPVCLRLQGHLLTVQYAAYSHAGLDGGIGLKENQACILLSPSLSCSCCKSQYLASPVFGAAPDTLYTCSATAVQRRGALRDLLQCEKSLLGCMGKADVLF